MNQIDTGKFIAGCRKEKGLTQAQLAEKLNITDRAVSKWETGKCMPDASIMLELCNILGVTVNELLSGERIEINNYEEKVNENLIELKRKDENNMNKNAIISTIYTIAMIIGIMVCCICDIDCAQFYIGYMDYIVSGYIVGKKGSAGGDDCYQYNYSTIYVHIKYFDKSE